MKTIITKDSGIDPINDLYVIPAIVRKDFKLEYKDDEIIYDYFPENISKVSPSAIIALTVFLDTLSNIGMDKVKVVINN